MKKKLGLLITGFVLAILQGTAQPDSLPVLFQKDSILKLKLTLNVNGFLQDTEEDHEWKAVLSCEGQSGYSVKINRKGHFRGKAANCVWPSIGLNLPSRKTTGSIWEGVDKLKLITSCIYDGYDDQNKALLEYSAYRIYSEISPFHFKVRSCQVGFQDSATGQVVRTAYGFLLEDDKEMASRYQGKVLKVNNIHPNFTEPAVMLRLAVFQYLIGNTDWSVKALHNIKLLSVPGSAPIAVPYDFDYSGLVNASYAVPPAHLPLSSVTERYYNGHCRPEQEILSILAEWKGLKTRIDEILRDLPLSPDEKNRALNYLQTFFDLSESSEWIHKVFIEGCRQD